MEDAGRISHELAKQKAHTPGILTRCKTEWYYLSHQSDCLVVAGWLLKFYETDDIYMNWGDDINVYVFELLTGKKVIPAAKLFNPIKLQHL